MTLELIRAPDFHTNCLLNKNISEEQRASIYERYNLSRPVNNTGDKQTCELDHLIPLDLGGADSLDNIWPLCGPPGAELWQRYFKQKLFVQRFLAAEVKAGRMSLTQAQREMAEDWTKWARPAWAGSSPQTSGSRPESTGPQELTAHTVDVLIATTRRIQRIPAPKETQLELVADEQRQPLSFGAARIRVPADKNHRIGQVERPRQWVFFGLTLYREQEQEKKHFTIRSTRWLSKNDFIDSVKSTGSDQALIFIHGFNTRFQDGLFRLAQIVWDTQFRGVPIMFSWPSKGAVLSYEFDRESAEFSVPAFRQLLTMLQNETRLSAIHIIAHSMGSLIAVQALSAPGPDLQNKSLGQLLLAAPDIDRDLFNVLGPNLGGFRGITLYASSADKALRLSHKIAQGPRAGDIPALPELPVLLPNIDTIDVTAIGSELFGLNHNTFASTRSAIDDIGRLLRTGERPPNIRTPGIRSVSLPGQLLFWRYAQ
ncbi:alpha/beta hydrolase [Bradyrhizobium sp. USDA 4354]